MLLFLFAADPIYASIVNCTNSPADANSIQAAVNSGGTVTLSGTCALGGRTINVSSPVSIMGPASLNGSGSSILSIAANNVSINGITFSGTTAAHVWGGAGSVNQNFSFTNNTVQNTNGADGLDLDPIMSHANISNNNFSNIAPAGFASYVFNGACYSSNSCDLPGVGIVGLNGWDNSNIQYNTFDLIASDAIHLSWNAISQDQYYFLTSNVSVSYNTFTRVHRMAIEAQGVTNYVNCTSPNVPANCSDLSHLYSSNFKVAGNYAHDFFQSYVNTYAYSIVTVHDQQIINNTGTANNINTAGNSSLGYAQETSGHNTLSQGNVYASDYFNAQNPHGWGAVITLGGSGGGANPTAITQNNYVCTDQVANTAFTHESTGNLYPTVVQYNYTANTCAKAGQLTTSSIAPTYVGTTTSGTQQTFNFSVVSTLSVRNVQFFLDGSSTPVATQELSDLNTNFANDTKWNYHVSIDTGTLGGGNHTLRAVFTDVSGASQSVTQNVSAGTAAAAVVRASVPQLSPANASFGSQTVGLASSAQVFTISNAGNAVLNISSIRLTAAVTNDFSSTSNCSPSLSPGASCTVSIVFIPSTASLETASLVVSNDSSSPTLTAALSGTGVAAVATTQAAVSKTRPVTSSLPTGLPKGMLLWLANDAGVITTASGTVSVWKDQSGNGYDASQPSPTNQPTIESANNQQNALHFNGVSTFMTIPSVPIAGLTGMSVFMVSSNSLDQPGAGYGKYALLSWPEVAAWGYTFFSTYQTSSHFRFGTTQAGNESALSMPMSLTNTFGLSEWVHSSNSDLMWFNGQGGVYLTGKLATLAGMGNQVMIGMGSGNTFYPGDLSEVIVYNRYLSTAERQTVENYLMTKYHL